MLRLWGIAMLVALTAALLPRSARAQDEGAAAITAPPDGAAISGLAPIVGTAAHPQFQRYELAFGYDPNPSDTWFSISDPVTTPVVNNVLGNWDTTGLTDGAYILRLRVYWSDRDFLEAFARVRIQNATPTPTRTPEAAAPTGTPGPAPTEFTAPTAAAGSQPVIALPPTSTPRPTPGPAGLVGGGGAPVLSTRLNATIVADAFLNGVRLTVVIFALLGTYTGLRALVRSRWRR
jgi:hypothetical protein